MQYDCERVRMQDNAQIHLSHPFSPTQMGKEIRLLYDFLCKRVISISMLIANGQNHDVIFYVVAFTRTSEGQRINRRRHEDVMSEKHRI